MIYVFCPYGLITGGPDALHQLVYYLNKNNINASIVYCDIKKKKLGIPDAYKVYIKDYLVCNDIVDSEENTLVYPETLSFYGKNYHKAKKVVWWLSVDNNTDNTNFFSKICILLKKIFSKKFFTSLIKKPNKIRYLINFFKNKKINFKDDKIDWHLCASYYAFNYVSSRTKKCSLLIEPISLYFLSNIPENFGEDLNREEIILYNPRKNFKFTKKIINQKSLKNVKFIPLTGYNQSQLCLLYQKSKLYIDFGEFPGAERIPKEAVINGCNILTGKNGASGFYNDVPILDSYKIESNSSNIKHICDTILNMVENYARIFHDFDIYRDTVKNLEKNFEIGILDFFK